MTVGKSIHPLPSDACRQSQKPGATAPRGAIGPPGRSYSSRAGAHAQSSNTKDTELLTGKHAVPNWWSQPVKVEYERARDCALATRKLTVSPSPVSKTIATTLGISYETTANATKRQERGSPRACSIRLPKRRTSTERAWNKTARLELEIGLLRRKGPRQGRDRLQVNKAVRIRQRGRRARSAGRPRQVAALLEKVKSVFDSGREKRCAGPPGHRHGHG